MKHEELKFWNETNNSILPTKYNSTWQGKNFLTFVVSVTWISRCPGGEKSFGKLSEMQTGTHITNVIRQGRFTNFF